MSSVEKENKNTQRDNSSFTPNRLFSVTEAWRRREEEPEEEKTELRV